MAFNVTGELYYDLDGQLAEIKRQLRQPNGYPFNPVALKRHLQMAIEGKLNECMRAFLTWKTIKLRTGLKTGDDFQKAIEAEGMKVGYWVDKFTSALAASDKEKETELIKVAVGDFFKKGATRKDFYERAIELGLALCPIEVGPQLRLQYKDQPEGECLIIATEPIVFTMSALGGMPNCERLLIVEHNVDGQNDGQWLNTSFFTLKKVLNPDDTFIFVRNKR